MGRLESGVPRILPVAGADPNDKTVLRERERSHPEHPDGHVRNDFSLSDQQFLREGGVFLWERMGMRRDIYHLAWGLPGGST